MSQKMQNPGVQAGASRDSFYQCRPHQPSISRDKQDQLRDAAGIGLKSRRKRNSVYFTTAREAALTLAVSRPTLSRRDAGFCGHVSVTAMPSAPQLRRLATLLDDYDLPPLRLEGAQ